MSWVTIYITGKEGFQNEILRQLRQSDVDFMPGTTDGEENLALYWIPESLPLRDFKKAISGKLVFKFRLRFYSTLELYRLDQKQLKEKLSPREKAMISEMMEWENSKKYPLSA